MVDYSSLTLSPHTYTPHFLFIYTIIHKTIHKKAARKSGLLNNHNRLSRIT